MDWVLDIPQIRAALGDAPFSRMNRVTCRNVLYLTTDVQERVLSLLHFALQPSGLLRLGSSESTSILAQLFATAAKGQPRYRKVGQSAAAELPRRGLASA